MLIRYGISCFTGHCNSTLSDLGGGGRWISLQQSKKGKCKVRSCGFCLFNSGAVWNDFIEALNAQEF